MPVGVDSANAARSSSAARRLGFDLLRGSLFVLAWLLLGLMRLFVLVAPFRRVRRLLGERRADENRTSGSHIPPVEPRPEWRARRIGHVVQRAAARTPWRSDCYPQALVAHLLLATAGIAHTVFFGLRRDESDMLIAHAWVVAGNAYVVGGDPRSYTVVGSFAWQPSPAESRKRHGNLRLLRPHAAKRDRAA